MKSNFKMNKVTIICFVFFVLILLDYRLFYLISYPTILQGNRMRMIFSMIGAVLSIGMYTKYNSINPRLFNKCLKFYFACVCSWLFLVLYSCIKYPKQPLLVTVVEHVGLLFVGLIIPALVVFQKRGNRLFEIANYIVFAWYVILLIQMVVYLKSGELIFSEELYSDIRTRSYGIRIGLGSFGNAMILYNVNQVFNCYLTKRKKLFSEIQIILGVICLIFVQQTRAFTAIVLLASMAIVFWGTRKASKKLYLIAIIMIGFIWSLYNGVLSKFLSSFSLDITNSERLGTIIRLEAIMYYIKCFVNTLFLGNGFANYNYYPSVQYGMSSQYQYYYSDVGIFGLIGEIGIFALLFYIGPLIGMCKLAVKILKNKLQKKYAFFLGLVVFLVATSATLIITDDFRIAFYPIVLAYGFHIETELKKDLSLRG